MSVTSDKRHRERVPVSCLNCKKRKVKCDKGKPCGGCVKNNVQNLCVYVQPKWAEPALKDTNIEESSTYKQMQTLLQTTIDLQLKELQCLRARLAQKTVAGDNHGDSAEKQTLAPLRRKDIFSSEVLKKRGSITILSKLSPNPKLEPKPEILHNDLFSMRGFRAPSATDASQTQTFLSLTTLYSWLNIIKLDPQLTALWYRITNMQKSYHIYKTNLLKSYSRVPPPVLDNIHAGLDRSESTASTDSASCGHHQCPVIACEFDLMLEESELTTSATNQCKSKLKRESESAGALMSSIRSEGAIDMLSLLQKAWKEILSGARNTDTMDYDQLEFLLEFYFGDTESRLLQSPVLLNEVESGHMLRFFREELLGLFVKDGSSARLEVGQFSPKMSDAEVVGLLAFKAVYLSMIGLIVEESIDCLHSTTGLTESTASEFRRLFPLESVHGGYSASTSQLLLVICDLVESLFKLSGVLNELEDSMAVIVLLSAMLNRISSLFERDLVAIDVREAFTRIFVILFELIQKDELMLQIWRDPGEVTLLGASVTPSQQENTGLLLCHLWNDFMRIVNNVTLNMIPVLKHCNHVNKLLDSILIMIPEIESSNCHLAFLESLPSDMKDRHFDELVVSIQVSYVMSRASVYLRNGIHGQITGRKVSIMEVLSIISEMAGWVDNMALTKLRIIRYFEMRTYLSFLEFFMAIVIFLQCEENGDGDAVYELVPVLFEKCMDLNKFLQGSSVQFSKGLHSKYVFAVIAENVAKMSHLISGFLIRFRAEPLDTKLGFSSTKAETLTYSFKSSHSERSIQITADQKEDLIRETDKTVQMLDKSASRENAQSRTKIWKFYTTFIRASHKSNSPAYANLSTDAFASGRYMDKCPIMTGSNYELSATRMEAGGCPVFHNGGSSASMLNKAHSKRSRCPISHADSRSITNLTPSSGSHIPRSGMRSNSTTPASSCPVMHENGRSHSLSTPTEVKVEASTGEVSRTATPNASFKPSGCPYGHGGTTQQTSQGRKRGWGSSADFESEPNVKRENIFLKNLKYTPPLFVPAYPATTGALAQQAVSVNGTVPTPFDEMDWDSLPNFNFDLMNDESLMVQINSGDFGNPVGENFFQ